MPNSKRPRLDALRRDYDALLVLVVTPENVWYAVDERLPVGDLAEMLSTESRNLLANLRRERAEAGSGGKGANRG